MLGFRFGGGERSLVASSGRFDGCDREKGATSEVATREVTG